MALSDASCKRIQQIAEVAANTEPLENRVQKVLDIGRQELGINSMSVIVTGTSADQTSTWHSVHDENVHINPSLVVQTALSTFSKELKETNAIDHFVLPITTPGRYQAALIGHEACTLDEHRDFLSVLSSYLSLLIENIKLSQTIGNAGVAAHSRIEEIAAIYDIGHSIEQAREDTGAGPLLNMIVEKASKVMDAQACSLMLMNERDGKLVIEASHGLDDDIVKGARIEPGEGIAGKVAESGEPMIIGDVTKDPRLAGSVRPRYGISGSMCVPLFSEEGSVIGVLSIRRHEPKGPFTEDELKLFQVFATHASLAISHVNLYSSLHAKVQEMSTISEVMRAINSILDLTMVLEKIVESITDVVGFERCCVYLLEWRTGDFVAGARRGYRETDVVRERVTQDDSIIGLAAREKLSIFSLVSPVNEGEDEPSGEFLVSPIMVRDECIGAVVVDNHVTGRSIEPENVELLATFVSQAGIAVENARLYEAMEEKYSEMNVIYEHSKQISAAYGLANVSDMLVKTSSRAIKCEGAGLLMLDTRRGSLSLAASLGTVADKSESIEEAIACRECVDYVRSLKTPFLIQGADKDVSNVLGAMAAHDSDMLIAPLVSEDATVGVLFLTRDAGGFSASEQKLISIISSHAATVMKNAIAYEQRMQKRVFELTALYDFSQRISAASNLEEALDSILEIVGDLEDYDESYIFTVDSESNTATPVASRMRDDVKQPMSDEPLDGDGVISWTIRERMALVSPDVASDERFTEEGVIGPDVRSLMSIPLIVRDEVVGVMCLNSYSPQKYSEEDVRTLSIIASQGAAIYKELEALTALTSYTDNILSSIAAGVVTIASDGTVLTWNQAAEEIVGVHAQHVVGNHFEATIESVPITEADKATLMDAITSVFMTGEMFQGYKMCFHPQDLEEVYLNMRISLLLSSNGEQLGVVVIFEDISKEIRMENDVRRMGELAAIGQLAASIAHELRNPLSSIKGAAQFLQNEYSADSSISEFLEIIIDEVNGLSRLTTEFLDFARPTQLELKKTSVNILIERTIQLMGIQMDQNNVELSMSLDDDAPEVEIDPKQLQQVLKNIIINAMQAMPEGGAISIETSRWRGDGAQIVVADTGSGIPNDKLEKILQPFFTTKTKGTGLGLSIVNKIIENHGGRMRIESEEGVGSRFIIELQSTANSTQIIHEADDTLERRTSGKLKSTTEIEEGDG